MDVNDGVVHQTTDAQKQTDQRAAVKRKAKGQEQKDGESQGSGNGEEADYRSPPVAQNKQHDEGG